LKQNEAGVSGLVLQSGGNESRDLTSIFGLCLAACSAAPSGAFVPFSQPVCDRAVVGSWCAQPGEPIQP